MLEYRAIILHPNQIDTEVKSLENLGDCELWFRKKLKQHENLIDKDSVFPYGFEFCVFNKNRLIFVEMDE
jgi:hypothetical protein